MRVVTFLFFITFLGTASALYYVDDADESITYSSSAGIGYGTKWRKYSKDDNLLAVNVDPALCFGKTASYTQCSSSDNCIMEIPFNGTGITLFVAQDRGDIYNTTISLDGGPRENHFAYTPPNATQAYNVTLYDIQNLEHTMHTVNVGLDKGVSRLLFDFAVVSGDAPPTRLGSSEVGRGMVGTGTLLGVVVGVLAAGVL
ncbi:hypothetical protein BDZ94DRAFT_1324260 [Collybia nuda]|uniref:Uncharacterized protein n=1 Tax=Collybia nuda TaxID=64659 RepID=A0A9P5XYM1_9AGAR|nr:hypothetical protein BDZ94DRAFT_1324260 [Collybia nuda]